MSSDANEPDLNGGPASDPVEVVTRDPEAGGLEPIDGEAAPSGTLFFMIILLLLMVGLWVIAYLMLLNR